MAQLSAQDLLPKILQGTGTPCDYILAAVERSSGAFTDSESEYLDHKILVDLTDQLCVAELARDVLAFSNTHGGLLIFGVTDERMVVGCRRLDARVIREKLGPYVGTMVDYEVGICGIHVSGRELSLPYILVPRCVRAYPNLLRKDILPRRGLGRKVKYVSGSLFLSGCRSDLGGADRR
jgi:hypothetical protein